MKFKKVLIIHEKYCDVNPQISLTNNFENIDCTFKRIFPDVPFHILHPDVSLIEHNTHIDKIIPRVYNKIKPDLVIMSLVGKWDGNPTKESFKLLKDKGCKIVVMWPDTGLDWGIPQIEDLGDLIDLNVSWDNPVSDFHNQYKWPKNHIHLFVPQDPKLFFSQKNQDVAASFIGSVNNQERQAYLNHAVNVHQIPILIRGGQRSEKLSAEQYSQLIRRSKIGINFSFSAGSFWQVKGRVYEVLASKSCLFEGKNGATSKLLTPNEDYVEYGDLDDFVNKLKHYMNKEEDRMKIAENGWKKYNEKYSSSVFWDKIMERL